MRALLPAPRCLTRIAVAALLVHLGSAAASAQFRLPEKKNFHNDTFVGEEPEAARVAFFRAQELLDQKKPLEAGREILSLLRQRQVIGLVQYSERLVLTKETAAVLKLATLPREVIEELRREEERLERNLSTEVLQSEQLLCFATEHPLTSQGEIVWLRAAEEFVLSGDAEKGAALLERLVHWPSTFPGTAKTTAAARLLQALRLSSRSPGAGPLLRWPSGSTRAAGAEVSMEELAQLATASAEVARRGADWPTLQGDDSRSRFAPASPSPPQHLHTFLVQAGSLEDDSAEDALHRKRFEPMGARNERHLPTGLPVVARGLLLHLDLDGLHLKKVDDGKDWVEPLRFDFDFHLDPRRFRVLLDRSSLSVHGSLVVLTLELRDSDAYSSDSFATHGAVFGLDLDREAFVSFGLRSFDLPEEPDTGSWVFTGPSVVLGDEVFVLGSRLKFDETECVLFALDRRTGQIVKRQFLARASAVARYSDRFVSGERRRVPPSPLAMCCGILYVCTNLGVVAAVRAAPRLEVEWIFRYNRLRPTDSRRYTEAVFFDTGGWPTHPPEVLADRVLVSPADSRYLYSLARWPNAAGDLQLNDPVEKENRIAWIGSSGQQLYFLVRERARQVVQATDHSGHLNWQTLPIGAGLETVCGMPAQDERYLYLPTDLAVYRLDLTREGFPEHIPPPTTVGIPFPRFGCFGDLVVTPTFLLSQSSNFLHVFRLAQ